MIDRSLNSKINKLKKLRVVDTKPLDTNPTAGESQMLMNNNSNTNVNNKRVSGFVENVDEYNLLGYYYYSKIFPECRQQFSWHYDGTDSVLFGGLVSNKSNDVWTFDPRTMIWTKLENNEFNWSVVRFGHTGVVYKKKLILFGGHNTTNYYHLPDVEILNLQNNIWGVPGLYTASILKLRKYHIACVIGIIY
jgi:hypothetical protein